MSKIKAFVLAVLVCSIAYTWQMSVIHYYKHGVYLSAGIDKFLLIFGFGLLSASALAAPVLYLFEKYKVKSSAAYMVGGSLSMGLAVTTLNNHFYPWQYPEGFIIGALAGLLYWALTKSNVDSTVN
jgi:hypothetical protein